MAMRGGDDAFEDDGVWFVYDGDCQICTMAAEALKIKADYGALHTLNARKNTDHPLMLEINRRQMDLDQGMVIYARRDYYFGKTALQFMARYSEKKGWFNRFSTLFKSDFMAKYGYPPMRFVRNMLLRLRGVGKIRNLKK